MTANYIHEMVLFTLISWLKSGMKDIGFLLTKLYKSSKCKMLPCQDQLSDVINKSLRDVPPGKTSQLQKSSLLSLKYVGKRFWIDSVIYAATICMDFKGYGNIDL